jgi:hypothetical protein
MVRIESGESSQASKLQQINSSLWERVALKRILPEYARTAIKTKQSQYVKHG